jgi:outer membrane protein assembly factor BamD
MLNDLMEKLAYKALLNCQLYYDLGNYMGNNYESCIVTAILALQDFPSSRYRVDLAVLILKSRYAFAQNSYDYLKEERFRQVIDEYYSFVNEFPQSRYQKEAEQLFETAKKHVK